MPHAATLAPEAATSDGRKRRVYVAQLLSMVGDQFTLIALPWLVYSESSDPAELGLVLGLLGAPRALTLILGDAPSTGFRPSRWPCSRAA